MEYQQSTAAGAGQNPAAKKNLWVNGLWQVGQATAKSFAWLRDCFRQAVDRADSAIGFFVGIVRQWYGAMEKAFFPGRGKAVAGALGCGVCFLFIGGTLLAEPSLQTQVTPAVLPQQPEEAAGPPFDLEVLLAEHQLRAEEEAKAAPVTVSVAPERQRPLTLDSLKNYELAAAPAGWWVDLSQLEGSGRERAAYLHDYVNSDTIGWLQIPGTNIDYPVMQGATLTTYMSLNVNRGYDYNGSLWVDTDVTDYSTNTVIFGHNWTNVSGNPSVGRGGDVMFAQLPAYAHLWFAQRVPYFYYSTTSQDMVWQVFAAFYTTDLDFYLYTNRTGSALQSIIDKGRSLSLHNFGVSVSSSDRIITLSTCTRALGSFEDQRFVVMAKLVGSGDANVQVS